MNPRNKFFRGMALVGALSVGLAACGDSITIPDPPATITAAPDQITLNVGGTQQIVASVSGAAQGVTFTSTNSAVATVSATGLVTAVTAGSTTIRVESTAVPGLATGVGVTVTAPVLPPTPQADLAISSVTQFGTLFPVDPANVFGTIDVTVSVERGPATSLNFFVVPATGPAIEIVGCRQTFGGTGTAADGLVTAANLQVTPDQTAVICSINTADFTVTGGLGVARFPNGNYTIRAELRQGATVLRTASVGPLTFNNADALRVTLASGANAISPATGLRWDGGTITATAVPVVYQGVQVSSVTFNYDGNTRTVTSPSATGFVATYATTGNNNIGGTTDPTFVITATSVRSNGQQGPTGNNFLTANANLPPGAQPIIFRYDSEAPNPGVLTLPVFGAGSRFVSQVDGWINASYPFNRGHGAVTAGNGGAGTLPNDAASGTAGVSGVTTTYHAALAADFADPNNLSAAQRTTVVGTAAITNGSTLNETLNNTTYVVVARVADALGNVATLQLVRPDALRTLGVDKIRPSLTLLAGSPANMAVNPGVNYTFAMTDTSVTAVPSGFGPNPVFRRLVLSAPGVTGGATCVVGVFTSNTCFASSTATSSFALPATEGYYNIQVSVADKAANLSDTTTMLALRDLTPPTVSNVAVPPTLVGGQVANFSAVATDNLNLGTGHFFQGFGTGGSIGSPTWLQLEPTKVLGTFGVAFDTELSATLSTTSPFVRGLQLVNGGGNPTGGFTNPDAARWLVFDLAGLSADQVNTYSFTRPAAAPATFPVAWTTTPTATNTTVCSPTAGQPACTTTPVSTQVGLTVSAAGTFDRPFDRIMVVRQVDPNAWISVGQSTSVAVTDVAGTRTWTYSGVVWTPGADFAAGAHNLAVIGINAAGDALMSNAVVVTVTAGGP